MVGEAGRPARADLHAAERQMLADARPKRRKDGEQVAGTVTATQLGAHLDLSRRCVPQSDARRGREPIDNLPGASKPLPNSVRNATLSAGRRGSTRRFASPWKREPSPSLELLRKVERELAAIEMLHDESDRPSSDRRAQRRDRQSQRDRGGGGAPTRLSTLDVHQVVARWRRACSANAQ